MSQFVPVLAYQKIGTAPKNSRLKNQWVSAKSLEKQLTKLSKQGYRFITPLDLQTELPAKPILLAFIGGYQSFYTEVFPLLKARKICATLCVAMDTLGTYNSWQDPYQEPWQNIVTVKQLKEMHQSGLVQVGTLGLDGRNLLEEEPTQARRFLEESIFRLEKLYKISPCAVAFWPGAPWNEAHAKSITDGLNLPVITSQKGHNPRTENHFLRILHPGLFTQFLLWKNK
ncbi:MAG: polysaccharide deacetylase family protein [Elusimicrobiaceae bacterium]|nr:polysaccharide deacetylase family protein [Elusimicrobiaceae bacterium]